MQSRIKTLLDKVLCFSASGTDIDNNNPINITNMQGHGTTDYILI